MITNRYLIKAFAWATVVVLVGGALAGCGNNCEPKELKYCPCLGGGTGAQQCSASGDYWTVCGCGSEQNDSLALALTGHKSHERTVDNLILFEGKTPDGRGDTGLIRIVNHLASREMPQTIGFAIVNGEYTQEISLVTGTNEVSLLVYEQEEEIAQVGIVVDVLDPEGDTELIYDPYAEQDTQIVAAPDTETEEVPASIGLGGGGGLEVTIRELGTDTTGGASGTGDAVMPADTETAVPAMDGSGDAFTDSI